MNELQVGSNSFSPVTYVTFDNVVGCVAGVATGIGMYGGVGGAIVCRSPLLTTKLINISKGVPSNYCSKDRYACNSS